jgi:hypothetical protein
MVIKELESFLLASEGLANHALVLFTNLHGIVFTIHV